MSFLVLLVVATEIGRKLITMLTFQMPSEIVSSRKRLETHVTFVNLLDVQMMVVGVLLDRVRRACCERTVLAAELRARLVSIQVADEISS